MPRWFRALALAGAAAVAAAQPAATALDKYLAGLATLRVDFVQRLTDSRGRKLESVTGTLVVQRPGRFRWEVRPADRTPQDGATPAAPATTAPYTQLMVADGRNVWFYDRELEQVTVRAAGSALTATPAMLLSGTVDLRVAFDVRPGTRRESLDWVLVKPKRADAEFSEARLGFAGGELKRMELRDKLGQIAVIEFGRAVRNATVPAEELRFTPPPGTDVIGKPVV